MAYDIICIGGAEMNIGEKIKEMRLRAGLSQTDVAFKLGTSKQNIYKYENGIVTNIPLEKNKKLKKWQVYLMSLLLN